MNPAFFHQIENAAQKKIITSERVYGGDINSTSVLTFEDESRGFLKWNSDAPARMFETEARGLDLLRNAETNLIIPKPLHVHDNWFLMEFITKGSSQPAADVEFGLELAKLHKHTSDSFGLNHDNFIGRLPQKNTQHSNWADFYFEERILAQINMLGSKISTNDIDKLHKVIEDAYPVESSALLHGDLWSGNYFHTTVGRVSIYDPAVYYGHREMDLAMSRLFGGFSQNFYEAYHSEYPIQEDFEERLQLSQLYPILVHANLFGGHYVQSAFSIIKKYT